MDKFKLTAETKVWNGLTLYRIEAMISFGSVKAGDKGGFVEAEKNLSHDGDAWVYGDAQVYGNAQVYGDAQVDGDARVYGDAWVSGNAQVYGDAQVSPINLIGLPYSITITDRHMRIGCEHHAISDWFAFDDRKIAQMDGIRASRFWKSYRDILLCVCLNERPDALRSETTATETA